MSIPMVPMVIGESTVETLNTDNLTTCELHGDGIFDKLMTTVSLYIADEFAKGRITGKDYATVFLGSMSAVLQASVNCLTVGKEVERLNAEIGLTRQKIVTELAQTDDTIPEELAFNSSTAVTGVIKRQNDHVAAQIALSEAQAPLIEAQAAVQSATVNLIGAQVSSETAHTSLYQAQTALTTEEKTKIAPQNLLVAAQTTATTAQAGLTNAEATTVPYKISLLEAQTDSQVAQASVYPSQIALTTAQTAGETAKATLIPKQVVLAEKQAELTVAQASLQTAQSLIVPAQGDLYLAQKAGFLRDAEQKLVKVMVDTWSARRMTDEATPASSTNRLDDPSIGAVITKALNGIGIS